MTLERGQMARLSRLLDEALALDEAGRRQWLEDLPAEHQDLAEHLRAALFLEPAQRDSLSTLPKFVTGQDAQAAPSGLEGTRIGPYRVLSLLGFGGMGSVWLAERADGLFTRQVALKLIHPALKSRVMSERFSREREILASLTHPNIARLLDAGFTEDGQSYLALDYIAGSTLITYCDEQRLGVRQRLELFRQVLGAVQYAHAHLVIHRDLKPANILVTDEGQAQLLDFGIAKLLTEGEARETELTRIGGRALTPDYAAPEQIAGAPITIAADVYALGVMLYELLTGERPYRLKRDSRGALEDAILREDPVAPSRANLSEAAAVARATTAKKLSSILRGDLETIAIKAMKKAPAERYATVNAFGDDIERYLRGDVVLAQPDSATYRALKFARRHWVGMTAGAIVVLSLAGGLAATSYEAHIASTQRDATLQAQSRSLTQTAAAKLKDRDPSTALGIIIEILPHGATASYALQAVNVFQEARAADTLTLAITGHTDRVRSAAFSPDGRFIVTASHDRTARIWDARTGLQVQELKGHSDVVTSAVFSPDGGRVVTSSYDKTARIWDSLTGRQLIVLSGHSERVRCGAFSVDGARVVTASGDKTARIWDAATGLTLTLLSGHADRVNCAAFSPDGRLVVTASNDSTARIWDATTGRETKRLTGHADRVITAFFSPDGLHVVTASGDQSARIWEVATSREIRRLRGHSNLVSSAAFSPDGGRIVTAAYDRTARVWDAASGEQLNVLHGHSDNVESAAFSTDGRRIVTAASDNTARVWDAASALERVQLKGHEAVVTSAAFSADGSRAVTASFDETARVWDTRTGQQISLLQGHTARVISAQFSPDGRRVVTSSQDKSARIWDAASGQEILQLSGHADGLSGAAFSPDGRHVATSSADKTARVWDSATGRQTLLLSGHTGAVENAYFSPDGFRIITSAHDNTARVWDSATGRQLMLLSGHTAGVDSAVYRADGQRILTVSDDQSARIWDAASGRELLRLTGHTALINHGSYSPDGRRVVTASNDNTARIWDAATGQQLQLYLHNAPVQSGAFSPDGRSIITAADDGIARIWDATTFPLAVQISWVEAAIFDPLSDSQRFELGLAAADERLWSGQGSKCDELAAAPYDPERRAPGASLEDLEADLAGAACAQSSSGSRPDGRFLYQLGRAKMAGGDYAAAKADLEQALARSYAAARIDLGVLLSRPQSGALDVPRALSLLEHAWDGGIPIAGFELGALYEHGVRRASQGNELPLTPDITRAWMWYEKAASAQEPYALARLAQRSEAAADLLDAFKHYAAAAMQARYERWPDEVWKPWRYRRASLARLLARDGMMQEVAAAYEDVRRQYLPTHPMQSRLSSSASR